MTAGLPSRRVRLRLAEARRTPTRSRPAVATRALPVRFATPPSPAVAPSLRSTSGVAHESSHSLRHPHRIPHGPRGALGAHGAEPAGRAVGAARGASAGAKLGQGRIGPSRGNAGADYAQAQLGAR